MPPPIALLFGAICTVLFLRFDLPPGARKASVASWIPTLWVIVISSRPISTWFAGRATKTAGLTPAELYSEGSPFDRNVLFLLIVAGLCVLACRRMKLSSFLRENVWIILFAAYACISVLWSDYPFVSFKRWVKLGGHIVMGAVVATEVDPAVALRRILARVSYTLIPLSIVLIKYYPDYGRAFNPFTGVMSLTGVTTHKNALGTLCMVAAIFLSWCRTWGRSAGTTVDEGLRLATHLVCGAMVAWLLISADSATATVTTAFGVFVVLTLNRVRGRGLHLLTPMLLSFLVLLAVLYVLGLVDMLILAIGEDLTLTGRTELWSEVLKAGTNPVVGAGFESFWLGSTAERLWEKYWWHPNQAHNGYIETYINLGIVGLVLLLGHLANVYAISVRRMGSQDFDRGRVTLTFLLISLLYNVTEAAFHGMSCVWALPIICGLTYDSSEVHGARPHSTRQLVPAVKVQSHGAKIEPGRARSQPSVGVPKVARG